MATSTGSMSTSVGPLDVQTIVDSLMKVHKKQVLEPLASKAAVINSLVSAYGSFKNALSSYQGALKAITPASLSTQSATASNAASGPNATTDAFTAEVNSDDLTKVLGQKLQSPGFAADQVFRQGDSLFIKVGNNPPRFITLQADATLEGLKNTINAAKTGVAASIIRTDEGSHLVLEPLAGGTANTIKMMGNNSMERLAYDPAHAASNGMRQVQAARDATRAATGSYAVQVLQLAQTQKLVSAAIAPDTLFDQGVLALKAGNGPTTVIKAANLSLSGLRDAINASDAGVNASIVNDGRHDFLVLASTKSGADNALRLTGTGKFAAFSSDPSGTLDARSVAADHAFTDGSLRLRVGPQVTDITASDTNSDGRVDINDLAQAINTAQAGVQAAVSRKNGRDHLIITPQGSQPVSLSGSGSYEELSGAAMAQSVRAQDARVSIDGVVVTSASNQVSNAISGVQLNLAKVTTPSDKFSLKISTDSSGMTAAANSFVTAYNTLVKTVAGLTRQRPTLERNKPPKSDPLTGDWAVREVMGKLRAVLAGNTTEGPGKGIVALSQAGIRFEKGGTLTLDAARFSAAVKQDPEGMSRLFSAGNGVLAKAQVLVDDILSERGLMNTRNQGLKASQDLNNQRASAAEQRLKLREDSYLNQYNRLNQALLLAEQRRAFLSAQLDKSGKK